MWKVVLWKITKWLFVKLPVETILAKALTLALNKVSTKLDLEKITTTVSHCTEALDMMSGIIADATITDDEVTLMASDLSELKKALLETWAKEESGKQLEQAIAEHVVIETEPAD